MVDGKGKVTAEDLVALAKGGTKFDGGDLGTIGRECKIELTPEQLAAINPTGGAN